MTNSSLSIVWTFTRSLSTAKADPGEDQDLMNSEPKVAERMRQALTDKLKEVNERYTPKP